MRRQDLIGIMVGSKSVEKVDKQRRRRRDETEVDVKWQTKIEEIEQWLILKSGKKQMILALSQTSPAAKSDSLHFYDRALRKIKNNPLYRGTFTA